MLMRSLYMFFTVHSTTTTTTTTTMPPPPTQLELYTAITSKVPIVALNVTGRGYDYAAESHFMLHLDTMIAERNPGTKGTSSTRALHVVTHRTQNRAISQPNACRDA